MSTIYTLIKSWLKSALKIGFNIYPNTNYIYNLKNMFKKVLAVAAALALFSTTAFAGPVPGGQPGGNNGAVDVIQNFAVSSATLNPAKGESVVVSFDMSQDASIYMYAYKEGSASTQPLIGTAVASAPMVKQIGAKTTWYGKSPNDATGVALADGKYFVKAYAYIDDNVVDSAEVVVNLSSVDPNTPKITNLKTTPNVFSAEDGDATEISFNVDKDAYLTVEVKSGATLVKSFSDYAYDYYKSTKSHSLSWDGTNLDEDTVAEGTYTISVKAKNDAAEATATTTVEVKKTVAKSSGAIKGLKLSPSGSWDPNDEELTVEFELLKEVKFLTVEAKQGDKVIEILDDTGADDQDYEETWDGTDDDGDFVSEGTWTINVRADGDTVSETVTVDYEKPEVVSAFVVKSSFDPSEGESAVLMFKVSSTSDATVEMFKGTKKELTLVNEEQVKKNRWYAVAWDGIDDDGDEVENSKEWRFKITVTNVTDDDIKATKIVEIDVENDDVSEKKSNITNDTVTPSVLDYDSDSFENVTFSYDIDEDAKVFIAVYEGESASGNEEVTLLDYKAQDAGNHTAKWDGKDEKGKELKNGMYSYKITTKTASGHKETEVGKFVVGNAGSVGVSEEEAPADEEEEDVVDEEEVPPVEEEVPPTASDCGGYSDTKLVATNNYEMCQAIAWANEQGIFEGYADGTFGPYNYINRAEVLKVVLEAFGDAVTILPNGGSNEGFSDADSSAWYMPYVRTAKFYGMLNGYSDGTAKLDKNINRVEFLKFVLEAAEELVGYSIPKASYSNFSDVDFSDSDTAWYKDYAGVAGTLYLFDMPYEYQTGKQMLLPATLVQRGEVALVLFRLHHAGILGGDPSCAGGGYGPYCYYPMM
jgi:flagellar hook assembly protein FlgD